LTEKEKLPLKKKIIEYIYDAIVNEEFIQGSQIKETFLSEKLGVSRAPIREAMLELVSLGILEQKARKGVFVKRITSKDVYDTYETKGVIEGFLASSFPLNATKKDIETLEKYLFQMKEAGENSKKVVKIGESFHKLTIKYATNEILNHMLQQINKKSQILFFKNWTKLYTIDEIENRHQLIINALKSKDRNRIEKTIKEHYFETGSKIVLLREVQK